jgi:transposase
MTATPVRSRTFTAAQRGQIIQRVLVDGWSPAQAAASCDATERQVLRWLAAYRRYGMNSLRREMPPERPARRWDVRARGVFAPVLAWLAGRNGAETARLASLRRPGDRTGRSG